MRVTVTDNEVKRAADGCDFADLTASVLTGPASWEVEGDRPVLVLPFDPEPTTAERVAILRRLLSADAAGEAELAEWQASLEGLAGDTSPMGAAMRAYLTERLGSLAAYVKES